MADRYGRARMKQLFRVLALAATLAVVATACSGDNDAGPAPAAPDGQAAAGCGHADTLVVYARDPDIAKPLLKLFEQKTRIRIQAHWGNPGDLAEEIISDGADTPADVCRVGGGGGPWWSATSARPTEPLVQFSRKRLSMGVALLAVVFTHARNQLQEVDP